MEKRHRGHNAGRKRYRRQATDWQQTRARAASHDCPWDTPEGRVFSLRSNDEGVDVSEVAKQYGGGGHRNASGFKVSFAAAAAFEV